MVNILAHPTPSSTIQNIFKVWMHVTFEDYPLSAFRSSPDLIYFQSDLYMAPGTCGTRMDHRNSCGFGSKFVVNEFKGTSSSLYPKRKIKSTRQSNDSNLWTTY
jgi:hypothetical protein